LPIFLLKMLLGCVDTPGGHLAKPPYPKHIEDLPRPVKIRSLDELKKGKPLDGPHLGIPQNPDDLLVDAQGRPLRIDRAYSWEFPLARF